jgi:hypothetical protein
MITMGQPLLAMKNAPGLDIQFWKAIRPDVELQMARFLSKTTSVEGELRQHHLLRFVDLKIATVWR